MGCCLRLEHDSNKGGGYTVGPISSCQGIYVCIPCLFFFSGVDLGDAV